MANMLIVAGDAFSQGSAPGHYKVGCGVDIEGGPRIAFFADVLFTDPPSKANGKLIDQASAEAATAGFPVSGSDKITIYSGAS